MGGGPTSWTSSHSTRPIFVNPHIRRPESMQFAEGLQRPLSCFEVCWPHEDSFRTLFVGTKRGGPVMSRTLTGLSLLLILLLPCTGSTLAQAEAGTWSSAGSMHDPRDGHTATLLSNGKLLIAGGCAGPNGNSLGLASAAMC